MREERNTFSEDLLNRKNMAVNLTKIIENKSDLRVLAIDSKWGSGKTTFVTMWENMIKEEFNDKFEIMYFNAWENDYIEEPLLSLLDELNKQIKDSKGDCEQFWNKFKDKSKPYINIAMQVGMKYLTMGAIDKSNLSGFSKNGIEEFSCEVGKALIENVSKVKKSRNDIKEMLVEFRNEINKKVIVFIDELDRCRPTFAIELLETIKHIFNIENYIFVVSLDKEQLSHSIKTLYGQGMDSEGYLRRFFDLEYMLPQNNIEEYIIYKNNELFIKYPNNVMTKDILGKILLKEKYSLRDIDKIYQYLETILPIISVELRGENYNKKIEYYINYIFVAILNLKFKNNELFNKILNLDYNIDFKRKSEFNIIDLKVVDMSQFISFQSSNTRYKSNTELKEIIQNISEKSLDKYLELYMKKKEGVIEKGIFEAEEYSLYVDENHKEYGEEYNLIRVFLEWDIIDKMTFVEQFKM